ncbi:MAG: 50S ribosomal protein L35 [Spirochaetes bacterium RBG_13_51_14]|nr:MAG: 50S ribosomal protein L35 [Spirochaetes bacterium RBG_13_51_14]
MPKMKTNSGAKKRFRITRRGKAVRAKGFKSHLLEGKSAKRKRRLRGTGLTSEVEIKRIKKMLPYG